MAHILRRIMSRSSQGGNNLEIIMKYDGVVTPSSKRPSNFHKSVSLDIDEFEGPFEDLINIANQFGETYDIWMGEIEIRIYGGHRYYEYDNNESYLTAWVEMTEKEKIATEKRMKNANEKAKREAEKQKELIALEEAGREKGERELYEELKMKYES